MTTHQRIASRTSILLTLNLALVTILVHIYFVSRYSLNWLDWDTATTTRSIEATLAEGTLTPSKPYPAGFGYQFMVTSLCNAMGISPVDLQQTVLPLTMGIVPVIVGICLFRILLGQKRGWAIAVLLLMLQAEFILTTSRGTHEKATLSLVLTMLVLLAMNLESKRIRSEAYSPSMKIAVLAVLLSLVFYNCFFAFFFFLAMSVSFVVSRSVLQQEPRRFLVLAPILGIFLATGFVVLYEPASSLVTTASSYADRLWLILSGDESHATPYAQIESSWTSGLAWIATNAFTLFLVGSSVCYAIYWLVTNRRNTRPLSYVSLFLGTSSMLVLAIVLDLAGGGSVTNLQIRWIPFWAVFAAPMSLSLVSVIGGKLPRFLGKKILWIIILVLLVIALALSLLRATLDPRISNTWIFYTDGEEMSVEWVSNHARGEVWGGLQYRIGSIFVFEHAYPAKEGLRFVTADDPYGLDFVIDSNLSRQQWERLNSEAFSLVSGNKLMDLGDSSVVLLN